MLSGSGLGYNPFPALRLRLGVTASFFLICPCKLLSSSGHFLGASALSSEGQFGWICKSRDGLFGFMGCVNLGFLFAGGWPLTFQLHCLRPILISFCYTASTAATFFEACLFFGRGFLAVGKARSIMEVSPFQARSLECATSV